MSEFTSIQIDFEVFQKIQSERKSFNDSDNNALRRLIGLSSTASAFSDNDNQTPMKGGINLRYGVSLPEGAQLRMRYGGTYHNGEVRDGSIWVNGKSFKGPSPAAVEITGGNVNGWNYWEVLFPGSNNWVKIIRLRK